MLTTSYSGDEKDYGYLSKDQSGVELVTKTGDEKANWFILAMRGVGGFFAGIWGGIVDTVKVSSNKKLLSIYESSFYR